MITKAFKSITIYCVARWAQLSIIAMAFSATVIERWGGALKNLLAEFILSPRQKLNISEVDKWFLLYWKPIYLLHSIILALIIYSIDPQEKIDSFVSTIMESLYLAIKPLNIVLMRLWTLRSVRCDFKDIENCQIFAFQFKYWWWEKIGNWF